MWTPEIKMIPIKKLAVLAVIGTFINLPQAAGQDQDSNGKTSVLAEHAYTINSTDSSANPSSRLDVSGSKTIRINFRTGNCTSCSPVRVDVVSNSTVIETFNIDIAVNASRVYEVPGTELTLRFANTIAGASNGVVVTVFGRSN